MVPLNCCVGLCVLLIVFGGVVFWLSFFFVGLLFFPVWVALFLVLLKKTKHRVSELREYKIQMDEDLKQSQGVIKNAQGKQMQVEQQCTALRQEVSKLNKCIQEEKNKVEESRLYIGQCKQQHGSVNLDMKFPAPLTCRVSGFT